MCLYVCIVLCPELQLAKEGNGPIHVHYHTHAKDCTFNIGSPTPVPPCPGKISSPVSWVQLLQQSSSNDVCACVRVCAEVFSAEHCDRDKEYIFICHTQ